MQLHFLNSDSIRADLRKLVGSTAEIADLKKPLLRAGTKYVSISHSFKSGVVVIADEPVGVDLEREDRVQPHLLKKFATQVEADQAPSLTALWCAKEAAYKCSAHFKQPPGLLNVQIVSWSGNQFVAEIHGVKFKGELSEREDFLLAVVTSAS